MQSQNDALEKKLVERKKLLKVKRSMNSEQEESNNNTRVSKRAP